ncbi:Rrp15p-domain-containing protein [Polychaeton citri CBS 116435]|uniref:Rrp15p-domain-containing protein n=1 Tax=Polychaeton citri CBS 116435 TaxID=1314669 RepID=A0A9P4Q1B2_9PEZI|nr:Rrp15p-domain-containing protein [Polychaeton citri CBS 116435]
MAPVAKRRRVENEIRKPKKRIWIKKQKNYHSSSEDEEETQPHSKPAPKLSASLPAQRPKPILKHTKASGKTKPGLESESDVDSAEELEKNTAQNTIPPGNDSNSDSDDGDEEDIDVLEELDDEPEISAEGSGLEQDDEELQSDSDTSLTSSQITTTESRKKRNDPTAFATSISKILDTKLTSAKRTDPVLSRSKTAAQANRELADSKLEQRARAQIRAEKRQALEKGRVKDVLGFETDEVETGKVLEEEKRLRKTAQRGVVKLFNAVRAAQVHADEGRKKAREEGLIGVGKREERVNEMSKQGFLDLISRGGKEEVAA